MRTVAAGVILLALAGCASQTQPRSLTVQAFEQRGQGRALSLQGQHVFVIRITNRSEESVLIHSISLSSFSNQVTFYNGDVSVEQPLEPGQTEDFPVYVDVAAAAMNRIYSIDSLDVSVTCESNSKGEFTETSSPSVSGQ